MTPTRRRGLLLLCFALVCGGLAASQVRDRERRAEAAVGPLVSVVVAKRELAANRQLRPGDLALRRVPTRFLPPDALGRPGDLAGARTAVPVPAGAYLTAALLGGAESARGPGPLRAGERALQLAVADGGGLASAEPGVRLDVLVSAQGQDGAGRTFVALENVELLDLGVLSGDDLEPGTEGDPASATAPAPGALATLRVTARQAVYLTAATNFAEEVRLLVRPPGDRERVGTIAVGENGL